jgi:exopolyphosphatase/guanosine-5'-triphosphate,3'-diphosphate pyrophosphatase
MSAIAVVDVGSNSIKVAIVDDQDRRELGRLTESVRLQQDVNPSDPLSIESQSAAAAAIGRLLDFARTKGATRFTVLGTSAVRECSNRQAFAETVRAATGVPLTIVSGEVEAGWLVRAYEQIPLTRPMPISWPSISAAAASRSPPFADSITF